jgi:hypothetical protein
VPHLAERLSSDLAETALQTLSEIWLAVIDQRPDAGQA